MAANTQLMNSVGIIGLSSFMPGVDPLLLLCACAGGLIFVISSKELKLWQRFTFVPISTFLGYIAAYDVQAYLGTKSSYLAAFICGAVGIAIILAIIKKIENGDVPFIGGRK